MKRRRGGAAALFFTVLALLACDPSGGAPGRGAGAEPELGPVDGRELAATDLERVRVGEPAPDFTLASLAGPRVTLSDYRGQKNVVLVFYRGHW